MICSQCGSPYVYEVNTAKGLPIPYCTKCCWDIEKERKLPSNERFHKHMVGA